MDQVHWIAGGDHADEVARNADVLGTDDLLHKADGAEHLAFGLFDAGARGRAQTDPDEIAIHIRKDLRAELG